MTTEKQTDILPKLPTEVAQRIRAKTHRSYHPNDFHREVVPRAPTKRRNQEMA
jgi:ribosomal protein L13